MAPRKEEKKKLLRLDDGYSFEHCRDRVAERYGGLLLTKELYEKMNIIARLARQSPKPVSMRDMSGRNHGSRDKGVSFLIEIVLLDGTQLAASYEAERDCITTFLPPKAFEKAKE